MIVGIGSTALMAAGMFLMPQTASASAATGVPPAPIGTPPAALFTTHSTHPLDGIPVSCSQEFGPPFRLVAGAQTLRAQAWLIGCTPVPPEECHQVVEIERLDTTGPFSKWDVVATKDGGWRSCGLGQRNGPQATYNCRGIIAEREFRTYASLAVMWNGEYATTVGYSNPVETYCM
jgi:hypothetical protein